MDFVCDNLEKTIPSFEELLTIPASDNNEVFSAIDPAIIPHGYIPRMVEKSLGETMLVRESVLTKLYKAQNLLTRDHPQLTLFVTYGYRSLETQIQRFQEHLCTAKLPFHPNPVDLYNAIHPFVAVPTVAGHPTGGAIDITIKRRKNLVELDFGSQQYDYTTKDSYVFINTVSPAARNNRMLLRSCMVEVGFVPHDAEWWHFSYGDWDWAYHTKQPTTLYSQVSYNDIRLLEDDEQEILAGMRLECGLHSKQNRIKLID